MARAGIWVSRGQVNGLTNAELRSEPVAIEANEPLQARDQFLSGELLNRQMASSDQVLTFTFTTPVDLVYVFSADHQNHLSSVDPFGGTPSETAGIPVLPGVPQSFPVRTSVIRVFEQQGGTVTVWGYRYG